MRTFNINPFPVDAKNQISESKPLFNEKSNPNSFNSILNSVKTENPVSKPKFSKAPDLKRISSEERCAKAPEKNILKNDFSEESKTVSQKAVPEKSSETNKKDKIAKNETKQDDKNPVEVNDEENVLSENSITVELNIDEMVQNSNALAQSLAATSAVVENEDSNVALEMEGQELNVSALEVSENLVQENNPLSIENPDVLAQEDSVLVSSDIESKDSDFAAMISSTEDDNPASEVMVASQRTEETIAAINPEVIESETADAVEIDTDSKNGVEKIANSSEKKSVFTVVDQRTPDEVVEKVAAEDGNKSSGNPLDSNLNAGNLFSQSETAVQNQAVQENSGNFQQILSQQIQNSAPEFVKAGNILLKDNNSGSINMVLKPENLGNVKVNLELSDKILSGQIVVQSKEAYEAFRQSMDTLKQAFQSNGFENANISLVLADNASSNGTFGQGQQPSGEQYMANKTYNDFAQSGESVDSSSGVDMYTKGGDHQIDVVA